jgi:hypothetical protein
MGRRAPKVARSGDAAVPDPPVLHLVDPATGEVHNECPACAETQATLKELTRKYHGALAQIGRMRADKEAEARQHELWPLAVNLFRLWQQEGDHPRARFTPERFWLLEPYLRREGYEDCVCAVRGCLASDFHTKRGRYATRDGTRHDALELIFRDQAHFERFRDMAPDKPPTIRGATMLATAQDVAERLLERAKLIQQGSDTLAVAHLLAEINRITGAWARADAPLTEEGDDG